MMKAYQGRGHSWLAIAGFGLALAACNGETVAAGGASNSVSKMRSRVRTLIFRPSDLPGFKLIRSGSIDSSGFTHLIVEGEIPSGHGWEQKWKRLASKANAQPAFISASVLLCSSAQAADFAVRGKMSTIAAVIDWRDRLSTRPPAAADRLFVSPPDQIGDGVYQVFGAAGKLAFHLEIHPAQGSLPPSDPALIDGLVRQLLARYTRMK